MPGLLQVPTASLRSWKLGSALLAELLGTAIFSLYGSATTRRCARALTYRESVVLSNEALSFGEFVHLPNMHYRIVFHASNNETRVGVTNSSLNNAIGNGWTLSVVIYITANISGAHINPAVTLATIITGHISIVKGIAYILCQVAGGIIGSLLLAGLLHPGVEIGNSSLPSGCFAKADVSKGQLFGWELIMTFVLVMTVYAVAIGEPSFGIAAPLAVGLALLVSVQAAGKFTGGALNPARVLGPSIVFACNWGQSWVFILAELAGGAIAGLFSFPLYGKGASFGKLSKIGTLQSNTIPLHQPPPRYQLRILTDMPSTVASVLCLPTAGIVTSAAKHVDLL